MFAPVQDVARAAFRNDTLSDGWRCVPEETPIAITYNGSTHTVMMGTPQDLEDFAVGFSCNEGIVEGLDEIDSIDVVPLEDGVECRMRLGRSRASLIAGRRRYLAGPTGCGLCGIESIAEATRPVSPINSRAQFSHGAIMTAMASLTQYQTLNAKTRAVHGAAYRAPFGEIEYLREDVGRHNALDKLAGALLRSGRTAVDGMILLTSRVSVEMIQKAAAMHAPLVVSVSAPTALAIRTAEKAGITLVSVARRDGFEIFTHMERICA